MTYSAAQPFRGTVHFRQHALGSLAEAIEWAQQHWTVRELPMAIHGGGVEPDSLLGSPKISPAFLAYLQASAHDTMESVEKDHCYHPQLAHDRHGNLMDRPQSCPDCGGMGTREYRRQRYRYPMWRALVRLMGNGAWRHHAKVVAYLIAHGWEWVGTWDSALYALRQLHDLYETQPAPDTRVGWVSKSESQRNAEAMV